MEFENVTIIVGATDEHFALYETVKKVMLLCDYNDIDKILIVRSKNASRDCIETILKLEKEYENKVFGVVQKRAFIGGAIQDGFDMAVSSHIMLLPGDMAIDIACVPKLIEREKLHPDWITKVSRNMKKSGYIDYPKNKLIFNKLAQIFLKVLYMSELTEFTCPVQIMPTQLYNKLNWKELNFPFLEEMILVPLRMKVRFEEVPVLCFGRKEGKSKNSFKQTALYSVTALRVRFCPAKHLLRENNK